MNQTEICVLFSGLVPALLAVEGPDLGGTKRLGTTKSGLPPWSLFFLRPPLQFICSRLSVHQSDSDTL